MSQQSHNIAIKITSDGRQALRDMRRTSGELKGFERNVARVTNRLKSMRQQMAQGVVGRGGGMVRGALGMAGVFGFSQAINDAKDFENSLTDIVITGGKSVSFQNQLRKSIIDVSNATGRSKGEVASYVSQVVTLTGNVDLATGSLQGMGKVAVATGANLSDLGGLMVKLSGNMKVSAKDGYQALNILRAGEKMGSVTLGTLASQLGKLTGLAGGFGKPGQGLAGVRALGGLMQITARGFSTDQMGEATTSAARFLSSLQTHMAKDPAGFARKMGINSSDLGTKSSKGFQFKALPEVFRVLGEAAARDPNRMGKYGKQLFGEQGIRSLRQLGGAAKQGWGKSGAYESAKNIFAAGGTDEIGKDFAKREASVGQRWAKATTKMQNTLHKHMLPVLEKATKHLPKLAKALEFILKHSETLFRLWLGAKGVAFFRQFMAPMQGAGGAGISRAAGGFGAAQWVAGFGQNGRSDLQMLRREQSRTMRVRRTAGNVLGSRAVGHGARYGLQAGGYGAVGMLAGGLAPSAFGGRTQQIGDQSAIMAGMSGGPVGGALAVGWLAANQAVTMGSGMGNGDRNSLSSWISTLGGGSTIYSQLTGKADEQGGLARSFDKFADKLDTIGTNLTMAGARTSDWYTETRQGVRTRKQLTSDLGALGGGFGTAGLLNVGQYANQHGTGALSALQGRLSSGYNTARQNAMRKLRAEMGPNAQITEEMLQQADPLLAQLAPAIKGIEKLLARFADGKGIQVTAQVMVGAQPGSRAAAGIWAGESVSNAADAVGNFF